MKIIWKKTSRYICRIQTQYQWCLQEPQNTEHVNIGNIYGAQGQKKLLWTKEKNCSLPQSMRYFKPNAIDVVEKLNGSVESKNQWDFNNVSKEAGRERGKRTEWKCTESNKTSHFGKYLQSWWQTMLSELSLSTAAIQQLDNWYYLLGMIFKWR